MADRELTVREVMIDVFEFPHVPYWFTLRQAAGILKKSISGGKCLRPLVILVFDEKYNLVGHLGAEQILREAGNVLFPEPGKSVISLLPSDAKASEAIKALSEKPASELMAHAKTFIDPDDSLSKAAEIMHRNGLAILPVLENQKKLVGIVRELEVFSEIARVAFRT